MGGNDFDTEITELFASYVDLCTFLQKNCLWLLWPEHELTNLREKNWEFVLIGKKYLGCYQASDMGTQKW